MASVTKRGEYSFRLQVDLGYDAKGKRLFERKTVHASDEILKSKRKLESFLDDELAKFKMEVESGQYIKPEKMTITQFVELWRTEYANNIKNLSPTTRRFYNDVINSRILPLYGHRLLDEIKVIELVKYLNKLEEPGQRLDGKDGKLAGSSIDNVHKTFNNIFERAKEWNFIKSNPMDTVKRPTIDTKEKQSYTESETHSTIAALFNVSRKRRLMCLGAILGGFRRGELNGLEWPAVNFEGNFISVINNIPLTENGVAVEKGPKSKSSVRLVKMPAWYMQELRSFYVEWKAQQMNARRVWRGGDRNYVFHNDFGEPYYYQYISKWWMKFCKKNQIRYLTFHELRHTYASLLLEDGATTGADEDSLLKILQKQLGHSKLSTTSDIYSHVSENVKDITARRFDKFDPKKEATAN